MGKTIHQLSSIGASLATTTEMEGQLSGFPTTGRFTLAQLSALIGGGTVGLENKGAVAGAVAFNLALYSDFRLSISANIAVSFSTPATPSYVLIEVAHTIAGTTITNLPGDMETDFAWATGAGETTVLIGRYNGSSWQWKSDTYSTAIVIPPAAGAVVDDAMTGTAAADLTAHTPTIGGALTKIFGTTGVAVTNGDGTAKVTTPDSTVATYTWANVFSGADQRIICRLKKSGSVPSGEIEALELWLRVDAGALPTKNGYYVQLINAYSTGVLAYIYKNVSGTNTEIGAANPNLDAEFSDGLYHELIIEVIGNTITTKLDGVTLDTATDSSLTAGRKLGFTLFATNSSVATLFIVDRILAENFSPVAWDTFTGTAGTNLTAHTPELGGAISKLWGSTGNAHLSGTGFMGETTPHSTEANYAYTAVFSGANQRATVVLKKTGQVADGDYDVVSLLLRADSALAGFTAYYAQIIDAGPLGGTAISINKKTNGGANVVVTAGIGIAALHDGNLHSVSFEISGSALTVKFDGATVLTGTDSGLTAGRRAMIQTYSVNPTAAQWLVDSFNAENL